MAETILMFVLLGSTAVYGIFKWSASETGAYNEFVQKVHSLEVDISEIFKHDADNFNAIQIASDRVKELSAKQADLEKQISDVQEHCAKLRSSHINLREKLSAKRPQIVINKPIPVEIRKSDKVDIDLRPIAKRSAP